MYEISRRSLVSGATAFFASSCLGEEVVASDTKACPLIGVNLAGAEFRMIGGRWKWPALQNMEYYLALGVKVFRIPFKWNRLQPQIGRPLDAAALVGLDELLDRALEAGAVVILDMHDYGRRDKIIIGETGSDVSVSNYASFWGELAQRYGDSRLVWYGLMNEPHDQDPILNITTQNAACKEIRDRGGKGTVLFSGIAWTGAHSWTKTSNGRVMLGAIDPADNFGFDMHQYLDKGFGGSNPNAIVGVGRRILSDATQWAIGNKKRIFIGEVSTGPSEESIRELRDLLDFIYYYSEVFLGCTYWAAGGVWGNNNKQTVDPPRDHPFARTAQLNALVPYISCKI